MGQQGIGEETESGTGFQKNIILKRVFRLKTWDLNWWIDPWTTSLFIGEIYSQLV